MTTHDATSCLLQLANNLLLGITMTGVCEVVARRQNECGWIDACARDKDYSFANIVADQSKHYNIKMILEIVIKQKDISAQNNKKTPPHPPSLITSLPLSHSHSYTT